VIQVRLFACAIVAAVGSVVVYLFGPDDGGGATALVLLALSVAFYVSERERMRQRRRRG
jgi:uncharacterized membrane protein YgaE (UPF0421/DUF939 family)